MHIHTDTDADTDTDTDTDTNITRHRHRRRRERRHARIPTYIIAYACMPYIIAYASIAYARMSVCTYALCAICANEYTYYYFIVRE
jgi:hypothetical protein